MSCKWIVVGISGATCSGKSTLASSLHEIFPQSVTICQDEYFFPLDSPFHVKVEELGHFNWEIMSALDMDSMRSDVENLLSQDPSCAVLPSKAKRSGVKPGKNENYSHILILEGFLLFNDDFLANLCDLRYFLTLTKEQCWDRRRVRIYDPPDVPRYFDLVVWPEYEKRRDEVISQSCMKVISGMNPTSSVTTDVKKDIENLLSKKHLSMTGTASDLLLG